MQVIYYKHHCNVDLILTLCYSWYGSLLLLYNFHTCTVAYFKTFLIISGDLMLFEIEQKSTVNLTVTKIRYEQMKVTSLNKGSKTFVFRS